MSIFPSTCFPPAKLEKQVLLKINSYSFKCVVINHFVVLSLQQPRHPSGDD